MPLAPEYEAMFAALAEDPAPALSELEVHMGREMYRMMRPVEPDLTIGSVREADADGVPVRIYTPSTTTSSMPVVVFFHGGGWVIGDLDTADAACRDMSEQVGCVVVSVDYRLAPEHPYPAAVDDSYTATKWVAQEMASLGGNGQIVVAGESAGGNLAAVMCQRARRDGGPKIAAQLLLYPVVDSDLSRSSYLPDAPLLTSDTMVWFWDHYCESARRKETDASPLLADDLSGLPPAVVVTAEFDVLQQEGGEYAQGLRNAGVDVEHLDFDGLVHDFFATARLFTCSRQAVDRVYAALKDKLSA